MQPLKAICAMAGVVALILIVVLAIVLSRSGSGSNLTEIALDATNKCEYFGLERVQMPKSLMVGPCEKYEAHECTLNQSSHLEIKATFPGAVIGRYARVVLYSAGDKVTETDACQEGLFCPDYEGQMEQSLYWKVGIKLLVDQSEMRLIVNAEHQDLYCVKFPLLVVA